VGELRNTHVSAEKPEEKRQLRRLDIDRRIILKVHFKEIRVQDVNWIHLALD
jgi:hypothetical protein